MRFFVALSAIAALVFTGGAAADHNYAYLKTHWPTTTQQANWDCSSNPQMRCLVIYDRSGYGERWYNNALVPALTDFGLSGYFQFTVRRGPRINLDAPDGIYEAYTRQHFAGIVIGWGRAAEADFSFAEMDGDPEMGDLPDWYDPAASEPYPANIVHTGLAIVEVDDVSRATVEHELGHAVGLGHHLLTGNYECPVFSVMCALGDEYDHLARHDFNSLEILYGHAD